MVLLSGGVDSTTLLHFVKKELGVSPVHALSFLYGQKHVKELDMACEQAKLAGAETHEVIDISFMAAIIGSASVLTREGGEVPDLDQIAESDRSQPPTYVPNRNMLFLSLAASYAESRGIPDLFYGAQAQDEYGYWDCTNDFLSAINAVLALNRDLPVMVKAPFIAMRKVDVLKKGLELGIDYSRTWTCYRGDTSPCGTCPSCVERKTAFEELEE